MSSASSDAADMPGLEDVFPVQCSEYERQLLIRTGFIADGMFETIPASTDIRQWMTKDGVNFLAKVRKQFDEKK